MISAFVFILVGASRTSGLAPTPSGFREHQKMTTHTGLEQVQGYDYDYDQGHVCQHDSSDADTLATFRALFSRWQGKKIIVAGDSLTDHVLDALRCAAPLLGAHAVSRDSEGGFRRISEFAPEGMQPMIVEQCRFYGFEMSSERVVVRWERLFGDASAAALFLNMAHTAFTFDPNQTMAMTRDVIRQAAAHNFGKKLVLFGHPPQHFDTASGEFHSTAKDRPCKCHTSKEMEGQAVWNNNAKTAQVAREHGVPFVDVWAEYATKCNVHKARGDCTHFQLKLALHVKAVFKILSAFAV